MAKIFLPRNCTRALNLACVLAHGLPRSPTNDLPRLTNTVLALKCPGGSSNIAAVVRKVPEVYNNGFSSAYRALS